MTKYPWLTLRGRTFYVRAPVPADIQGTFGRKEIWKTLGTQDRNHALNRYHPAATEIRQQFEKQRVKLARDAEPPLEELAEAQLKLISDAYFVHLLEEDDGLRESAFEGEDFEAHSDDVEALDEINRAERARGIQSEFMRDEAREVLSWTNVDIRLSETSLSWPKLVMAIAASRIKAAAVKKQRNAGEVIETPPTVAISRPAPGPAKPTLKDARDFYVKERITGDDFSRNKNTQRVDRMVRYIEEALKDVPALPDWTPLDAYKVRDYLLVKKQMKPATVRRELNTAKGIFSLYKKRLRRDLDNPFSGIELPASMSNDKESRDPLTTEQIVSIRNLVVENNNTELALIWRLLERTGCRLAEVTGLRREDVVVTGDLPHLRIVSHSTRRIKTNSSIRDVPLVGDSLAAAKEALKQGGDIEAVFARYSNGGRGANAASALLMRRVRQVTENPKVSVHSLRHSFADQCDLKGVSPVDKSALLGHLPTNASERHYGSRQAKLTVLVRAIGLLEPAE